MGPSVRHIYFLWLFCWAQWKPWLLMNVGPREWQGCCCLCSSWWKKNLFHLELQLQVDLQKLFKKSLLVEVLLISLSYFTRGVMSNMFFLVIKPKKLKAIFSTVFIPTKLGVPMRHCCLKPLERSGLLYKHYTFRRILALEKYLL